MKKILVIVAMALAGLSNAQELNYGIKVSYNSSNVSISSPAISLQVLPGSKSGVGLGGFVEYSFQENLSFQADIAYNLLGTKSVVDLSKLPTTFMGESLDIAGVPFRKATSGLSLHQISVPVSLKYNVEALSILAGVHANFVASVSTEFSVDGKTPSSDELPIDMNQAVKDNVNATNFGLHFGTEYSFSNGLFVEARYNYGLTSLNKNFTDFITVKQRYVQLGVGYRFK